MSSTQHLPELESLRSQVAGLARELAERDRAMQTRQQGVDGELQDLRKQSDLLQAIMEGTAADTGDDFFASLATHLTSTLHIQYAVIGEVLEKTPASIRTLAVSSGGTLLENFEYDLAAAPCRTGLTESFWCFEQNVQALFPNFPPLAAMGVESHSGVSIRNKQGKVVGLIVVMDTQPIAHQDRLQTLLQVFAPRVAAELQRKQAEHEHRQALHELQSIMETVPDFMFTLDTQGNMVKWNHRVEEVTGYSSEELHGTSALAFVPAHEQEQTALVIQRALTDGKAELEGHLLTKDQRTIPYHWTGAALKDPQGRIIGITGIGRDVSEVKQAQLELARQRQHLVEAQALAHLGSWEWDIDSGEMDWSDEHYCIFGHEPRGIEITDDTFLAALLPDDHDRVLAAMNDALLGKAPYDVDCRIVRPTGEIRTIHCRGEVTRNDSGYPLRMSGTILDITERTQVEEALRTSEERWQLAIHGSSDGIWDWNIRTGEAFFSAHWKEMRGYDEHELTNSLDEWRSRIHPDDLDRVLQHLDAYLAKHASEFCEEYRVLRKDGSYMWVLDRGVACWDRDGQPVRMAGSESDITTRKQAEEKLQRTQFAMDSAADAIYWIDPAAHILYANDAASAMLGYSLDELRTMTVHDLNPDFQADQWPGFWTETQQRTSMTFETFHRAKPGHLIPIEIQIKFLAHDGQEFHCVFVRDISERKRAEQALGERVRLAGFVAAVSLAINQNQPVDEMLDRCIAMTIQHLGAAFVRIWTIEPSDACGNCARVEACTDQTPCSYLHTNDELSTSLHGESRQAPLGILKIGQIAQEMGTVWTNDVLHDDRLPDKQWMQENGLRSFAGIPLIVEGRVFGILGMFGTTPLSEPTVRTLESVCHGMAAAIARKLMAEDLRRSKAQLSDIMENNPAVVYTRHIGDEWPFTFVTPNIFGLLGYTSIDLISNADLWDSLMHPDDLTKMMAQALPSFLRKGAQTFVARFRHRDGQYRWIENQARLTHLGDGPLLMVGTMTDITERIRAEEALRESEERFALAVEGSTDILWDAHLLPGEPWYAPQTLIWWSPRVRELLGLEETESFETLEQWATRLHPDDKDRVFGQLAAHLEHRVPYDAEYRLRTNRGNYRWIRGRGQGIWDEQGEPRRMSGSCQDITERKLAEQALQLSELHVKSIVEASPECIKLMAADGTLLQMNAAGLAMIEAERAEDVIGKCVYPLIAPEYRDRFRALNESVCQGTKESLEFELEGAHGTRRWMETHAVPLRNPTDGSVVHLAITRDITKRKQAEEALRASEERFRAVVESSTNGLVMIDGDGRIVLLNRQIERLFGYRREALLGQPIEALIPPRFRRHHPNLRAAYQKNSETMMQVRGRNLYGLRQDGGEFPVEIELNPIETGNGPMTLASVMDLTERKRAEDKQKQLLAELAESQKHFEHIFHWTPSAVAISTLAEGRFLDVNDRLVQLTGYSREELIGHTTAELRLWADPPERARVIQEILQQRSLHNKEGLLRTKSGELRTIMISVDRIHVKATPCLIYVAHDITERKQAEITQARQYEALQAIFRMTVALSHASSLEELYEQGIDGVQRALKVDRASILLFDEDGVMRFKASRGLSEEYKMAVEGHSPWSREIVNPQPMLIQDVVTDPSVAPYREIFVGEGIAALGFIPLVSAEELLGKFMLYYDTPHQFTEEEIQIAQTIASHVALMIQRKRAVAMLRHSEHQLRTVLDSLPIGVWFTDRTGKTLLANPAAKQIWSNIKHVGLQTQDNPSGWWETLEPANEPHRWALGHALTTGKSSLNETLDLEGLDGGKKTIRNTTVPVRDESGTVLGAVILNEDLTEIRRVQEALMLTQFSVDHAVEGFFWIGPDARILHVNDAACRMLEYSREELMAMTVHDIDPHFPPELWPIHWEELKQKGSVALESKQWSKTGHVLDVEITVSYLRYADREYHCAIMRDIGERKKAEQALRESEDRLQRALEASGAGTWRVDLRTGLDTRDAGLNRLLGLPAETTAQPVDEWFAFLHPDDRPAIESAWQSASINSLYEVEHRLIRRDGAIRWVYDRGRFVRDEVGQPLYATGAVIDITEQKRVEESLRQRENELRAALEERERISQDLHDGILQSLYAIGLGLEACKSLQQQQQQQRKKTAKAITQALDQAVGQLNTVMGEVRNFIAGLDSDVLQSGKFSIALRAMIQMLVANHPMRCHLAIDETAVCSLSTEQALHIMNIVREAISNSLRHGHATKATVSLKPLARSIRLTIRDNGEGFEPADAHSLGHGLSNMRARAKKMGGRFSIRSTREHGTHITIDLPKETGHAESESARGSTPTRR